MATSINRAPVNIITLLFLCVLQLGAACLCESSAPGMYVFGDSLVDVGNNNDLPESIAKANIPHNGIDFPDGKATGRFSNGKNLADFLAEKVGLPSPPPYRSLGLPMSKAMRKFSYVPVTGVSFASGGAGILNGTDEIFKESIHLAEQVEYYSQVRDALLLKLGSEQAQARLNKSLFLVVIGSNDLFTYYNKNSTVSKEYTPQQYVDLMVSTLKGHLKRLYELGARKFMVSGVGEIGCCPAERKENINSECNRDVNSWSVKFDDGLKALLQELITESSDIHYSYFETYSVMDDIIQNPEIYGITEIKAACCGVGNLNADAPCVESSPYCSNRKTHLFWDLYHPTEYTSNVFADSIYNGSQSVTTPMNVQQLVNV